MTLNCKLVQQLNSLELLNPFEIISYFGHILYSFSVPEEHLTNLPEVKMFTMDVWDQGNVWADAK